MVILTNTEKSGIVVKAQGHILSQLNNCLSRETYASLQGLLDEQQIEIIKLVTVGDNKKEVTQPTKTGEIKNEIA